MIYLHHYPASLFSEKVRALLGHYGLAWHSVEIPPIMPRPLLMPLSGGYRRTPVLQIGANIYADTKIICQALARHVGDEGLFAHGFTANRVADWADTELFRVTVALNFRPEALGHMMQNFTPEQAQAFTEDRATLTGNQPIASYTPGAAMAVLRAALGELQDTLQNRAYLFGEKPSVADFSVYHNLWFLNNNPLNQTIVQAYPAVMRWYETMSAMGHGEVTVANGDLALECARDASPELPELQSIEGEKALGTEVAVTPVDYGCIPVAGTLVGHSRDETIIHRETEECGTLFNHFPQAGFAVSDIADERQNT